MALHGGAAFLLTDCLSAVYVSVWHFSPTHSVSVRDLKRSLLQPFFNSPEQSSSVPSFKPSICQCSQTPLNKLFFSTLVSSKREIILWDTKGTLQDLLKKTFWGWVILKYFNLLQEPGNYLDTVFFPIPAGQMFCTFMVISWCSHSAMADTHKELLGDNSV